jgi:hypothetical protein
VKIGLFVEEGCTFQRSPTLSMQEELRCELRWQNYKLRNYGNYSDSALIDGLSFRDPNSRPSLRRLLGGTSRQAQTQYRNYGDSLLNAPISARALPERLFWS